LHVRLFASLVQALLSSNRAYLEHLSPSQTNDDGFESRRHGTAHGQNAKTRMTKTVAILNQHSIATAPLFQTNSTSSKDPD
jgi:hypothetical protein